MIDWDEVAAATDADELREAKLWLFQENIRLENERRDLEASRDKYIKERICLQRELDELNRRTVMERKRLKEENLFFEKKLAILQDGFRQLDEDRRSLEQQKRQLAEQQRTVSTESRLTVSAEAVKRMFDGTGNPLALRKRYRDLVKIFHPDNLFGDAELIQLINKEYARRREEG